MIRIILVLLVCWLLPLGVIAQLDNAFFYDRYSVEKADSGDIRFGFEAFGFLQNNEFNQQIIPGYTLFGYQLRPWFAYHPSGKIRIEAGGFFNKDFGRLSFTQIRPVLSLKYRHKGFSFIFGTLEGAMTHRLVEPVYDFERVINNRIEDGLQVKYVADRIFLDLWLEWINMIDFGDPEQEAFNTGLSFSYYLIDREKIRLELPVQFLAYHRGGQIDVSDRPAGTVFNTVMGAGLVFPMKRSWWEALRLDAYLASYQSAGNILDQPESSGTGWYINMTGDFRWFDLMVSWWKGNDFISPQGGRLYQSLSYDYPVSGYYEPDRDLMLLRFLYERELYGGLSIAVRVQPMYDIGNGQFDHMESLYLRYRTEFILNRKKSSE